MISNSHREFGKSVLREHRDLEALLVSILQYVHNAPDATPEVAQHVAQELRRLRDLLVRHFEFEETGGLFRDLRARLPSEAQRVDSLKEEHSEFLDDVDELVGGVEAERPGNLESLRRDLATFLSTYQEHEQAENQLLQRAYYDDLGAPD